jgi:hypothetical protein
MVCARPSTTTAPATPAPRGGSLQAFARLSSRSRPAAVGAATAVSILALACGCLAIQGCAGGVNDTVSRSTTASACLAGKPDSDLVPGEPRSADLDGDGSLEQVLLDPYDRSLSISDDAVYYQSRDKWTVVQAALGDTDGNGLTEVVALLDSEKGRHLGLFAYFGGQYRERLVTAAIFPAPIAIGLLKADRVLEREYSGALAHVTGDVVELFELATDASVTTRVFLRWNGFGFTRIEVGAGI